VVPSHATRTMREETASERARERRAHNVSVSRGRTAASQLACLSSRKPVYISPRTWAGPRRRRRPQVSVSHVRARFTHRASASCTPKSELENLFPSNVVHPVCVYLTGVICARSRRRRTLENPGVERDPATTTMTTTMKF